MRSAGALADFPARAKAQIQKALQAPTQVPTQSASRAPHRPVHSTLHLSAPSNSCSIHGFLRPACWAWSGLPPACLPLENPEPGGHTWTDACGATCPPPGVSLDSCGHHCLASSWPNPYPPPTQAPATLQLLLSHLWAVLSGMPSLPAFPWLTPHPLNLEALHGLRLEAFHDSCPQPKAWTGACHMAP